MCLLSSYSRSLQGEGGVGAGGYHLYHTSGCFQMGLSCGGNTAQGTKLEQEPQKGKPRLCFWLVR